MLTPATRPRAGRDDGRLLRIDPSSGTFSDARVGDLPRFLRPGDLVVVNDAATLPASLACTSLPLELRLTGAPEDGVWGAVAFGSGDWHARTEDRPAPPRLAEGLALEFGAGLHAVVAGVSDVSPRLLRIRFLEDPDALWPALYRAGRPVQYSYLEAPLDLWDVQTAWASRPWAAEAPSAALPLTWKTMLALVRAGVRIASLTHSAGLSSTGDPALDARLPLDEAYDIPEATVAALRETRGRVVAVGTTVVRALEGSAAANGGVPVAGPGRTSHLVSPDHPLRVVHGIFSGMHEPETSHHRLLEAFAPAGLLAAADAHAERAGYLGHEFGDACLVLRD